MNGIEKPFSPHESGSGTIVISVLFIATTMLTSVSTRNLGNYKPHSKN